MNRYTTIHQFSRIKTIKSTLASPLFFPLLTVQFITKSKSFVKSNFSFHHFSPNRSLSRITVNLAMLPPNRILVPSLSPLAHLSQGFQSHFSNSSNYDTNFSLLKSFQWLPTTYRMKHKFQTYARPFII